MLVNGSLPRARIGQISEAGSAHRNTKPPRQRAFWFGCISPRGKIEAVLPTKQRAETEAAILWARRYSARSGPIAPDWRKARAAGWTTELIHLNRYTPAGTP